MPDQSHLFTGPPVLLSPKDAGTVFQLYTRCADYFCMQDGEAATLSDAHALFLDIPSEKSASDQTVMGWPGADGITALAAIVRDYPSNGIWYLGFLLIDPALRGQGLGRSLYEYIEQWATARGAAQMRLAVLDTHLSARYFWHAMGFAQRRRVGPDDFKSKSHYRIEMMRDLSDRSPDSPQPPHGLFPPDQR